MTTVLISGASVAGTALAYWLREQGLTPVVVERAPRLRPGGQAVDVRGAALTVLRRMGLEGRARELENHTGGMNMLDAEGNEVFRSEEFALSSGDIGSEDIEILREDLVEIVYERTEGVEYLFGDSIAAIRQEGDGVTVEFEHAAPRRFDLVVGADGLHSNTRRLAFGPESQFIHHLGTYLGVFSQENYLGLDKWQTWFNDGAVGGTVMTVRHNAELRIFLGFGSEEPIDYDYRDVEAQKRLIADHVTGLGWEVPGFIERMWGAEDFYFDAMAQIRMDAWSAGRVGLVGDAAHCAAPLSGQGTSLALVGAYILALELGRTGHEEAFARYEARMRPFVEGNQALALIDRQKVDPAESTARLDAVKHAVDLDGITA
ncbi:FAD-dependent monooxygenase [Glycomyces harbinensis]|uniref:2-polyprenyl-6-methoxyphenol hydroxylase n=1 Tax=Glycomyces harbinensis TaxID=58114 RepID=A0A1G7BX49_9ACTN|nr:FAD-dependent monooxygenase [Glycomyces harbinensis]SDE31701.1 2-polyprenyl-6-methoxyphenol hydroxylase [Glycomyces harbinensis]